MAGYFDGIQHGESVPIRHETTHVREHEIISKKYTNLLS